MTFDELYGQGITVDKNELKIPLTQSLLQYIESDYSKFVRFIACYQFDLGEMVVFDLEVEAPQLRINEIENVEPIGIFVNYNKLCLEVLALRHVFPRVPHLNLRNFEYPRSLCIFEERVIELKTKLTPAFIIKQISRWLSLTARGELHGDDQPLEPLMASAGGTIIIPFELLHVDEACILSAEPVINNCETEVILVGRNDIENFSHIVIKQDLPTMVHGIINYHPNNLKELNDLFAVVGVDIVDKLIKNLKEWYTAGRFPTMKDKKIVLLIKAGVCREEQLEAEGHQVWAYIIENDIQHIGEDLGVWETNNGTPGLLLSCRNCNLESIQLAPKNVQFAFSRIAASIYNNVTLPNSTLDIAMIGIGAFGSQLFVNLMRAGVGKWKLIDNDILFPHNLARHALSGDDIGHPKAERVALLANKTIFGNSFADYIVADVLEPGDKKLEVESAFRDASVIIDASTSIAVANYLSCDIESDARRVSVFLNPLGNDSVVLIEDGQRNRKLNFLEMQYYRFLLDTFELHQHLRRPDDRIRYTNACRAITSRITQDHVALHSAICSNFLKRALAKENAVINIWHTNSDMSVNSYFSEPSKVVEISQSDWKILTDEYFVEKTRAFRLSKLPNETGGILIGSFDTSRNIVYIVDFIPAPPGSIERRTFFIRGTSGLRSELEKIDAITHSMLRYVGEWHSHPDGCGCEQSDWDKELFGYLHEHMKVECFPAVMLIVSDCDYKYFVE